MGSVHVLGVWESTELGMGKKRDGLPKGVMRREATRELVCDVRFTQSKSVKGKFHATQIESLEEGAFFYDIVKLYERRMGGGSRHKARHLELNYQDRSPKLDLCELPEGFNIKGDHKEQVQKLILEQARRAARELIQSQKCPRHVVDGRQSALNDLTSTHQNAPGNTLPVSEDKLSLSDLHAAHGVQRSPTSHIYDTNQHNDDRVQSIKEACKLLEHCRVQYLAKVAEREDLERRVAGTNEAMGIISLPNSKPENFYEGVAFIKQIIKRGGELFGELEKFEQAYKSEESMCGELRKGLEEHNLKSISESLIGNQVGKEVEVLHVIRSISELLAESPRDVLQNPWVTMFFSPDSNGGVWNSMELENMSKILNNSPTWF